VAEGGRHRLLQLSRGADKRSNTDRASLPRHQPMATHAAAAKSEGLDDQGTDRAVGQRLAPKTANPSSLARCALCSQTPKVGAVCPNGACTVLGGGREVTRVPTAILGQTAKYSQRAFVVRNSPDSGHREDVPTGPFSARTGQTSCHQAAGHPAGDPGTYAPMDEPCAASEAEITPFRVCIDAYRLAPGRVAA
jgi:hypothetical protein